MTCGLRFRTSKPNFTSYIHIFLFTMLWLYMILGFERATNVVNYAFLEASESKVFRIPFCSHAHAHVSRVLSMTSRVSSPKKEGLQQNERL